MKREELVRTDFPSGPDGFDRDSVEAHLTAVAAQVAALEARISALEVERDTLRRKLAEKRRLPIGPRTSGASFSPTNPPPKPPAQVRVFPTEDEVKARLTASKLALDGKDRDTIRTRLESDYDLDDTDALVDDVLERLA